MDFPSSILLLVFFFLLFLAEAAEQSAYIYHFCGVNSDYTTNSTYETNLNTLLISLSSPDNNNGYGFYTKSDGEDPDKDNGFGLCRGDVNANANDCESCVSQAGDPLKKNCPVQKEAVIWYDYCMLRYCNEILSGAVTTDPAVFIYNNRNVSSGETAEFIRQVKLLLKNVISIAAAGGSSLKFSLGSNVTAGLEEIKNIYGFAQCTPDLSNEECTRCLEGALTSASTLLGYGSVGGNIVASSCILRYEIYKISEASPPSPSPPLETPPAASSPPPPPPSGKKKNNTSRNVIIAVTIVVSLVQFGFIRDFGREKDQVKLEDDEVMRAEALQFEFDVVRAATSNFSDANKLGQGGFGAVYKVM